MPNTSLNRRGCTKAVSDPKFSIPALEPVEVLLLFVQFGQGELLLGEFAVDLGVELAALGDELDPLRLSLLVSESITRGMLSPKSKFSFWSQ